MLTAVFCGHNLQQLVAVAILGKNVENNNADKLSTPLIQDNKLLDGGCGAKAMNTTQKLRAYFMRNNKGLL